MLRGTIVCQWVRSERSFGRGEERTLMKENQALFCEPASFSVHCGIVA